MGAMKVWDGTTWQTVAPFSERASCFVGPDQPAGVAYAGDLWWDTDDPTIAYPGAELAYNQITANGSITATTAATANLIIDGTSRAYDGSSIMVETWAGVVTCPVTSGGATILTLWDGSTDLGVIGEVWNGSTASNPGITIYGRRRITPTVGTHNYRLCGWTNIAGTQTVYAGAGGTGGAQSPAYIRVTRV